MKTIYLPTGSGNPRGEGHKIDEIIIHAMSEYIWDDILDHDVHAVDFLNKHGLSCHYIIDTNGRVIECSNPIEWTAWHAKGHNLNSIGIEILVPGRNSYEGFVQIMENENWIGASQLDTLSILCTQLTQIHGIKRERIRGHCDVDPDRKVDPGKKFNVTDFANSI